MKAWKVRFKYPEEASLYICADTEQQAIEGAKQMTKNKLPDAFEFSADPVEEQLEMDFDAGIPTDAKPN